MKLSKLAPELKGLIMRILTCLLSMVLLCGPALAQQPPAKVVTTKVFAKELAQTRPMVGVVDFNKTAGLSPEISGLIARQSIEEGVVVKKGAVLVQLNTDFLRKDIAIINQEIAQKNITIQKTEKNLQRLKTLRSDNIATEKEFDDLGFSLQELFTQRESLRVKLAKKELELAKSTLRAPFDGLVLAKYKAQGEWISPGVAVCLLGSINDLVVRVAIDEKLVAFVQPGLELSLTLTPLNRQLTGRLANLIPVADPKSKTFQISIAIPYFKGVIQNMSARADVPVSAKTNLKMIPRDALVRHQGKELVYTVKEGKAKILPIHIVAVDGEYLGVDNPYIVPGMPIVVDGNERLRPDQAVTVIKAE
jgi:membrane fusion protein (multidrug efflux system)